MSPLPPSAQRVQRALEAAGLASQVVELPQSTRTAVEAAADFVRAATGYAIGGVPPFGHDSPLQTLIDEGLPAFDTLWAAAGTPRSVFALRPADLVAITGGQVVRVAGPSLPQEVTP